MPLSREVDFVAVDEVQLATHEERGHVFTERLLHARGRRETWFLGSGTMRSDRRDAGARRAPRSTAASFAAYVTRAPTSCRRFRRAARSSPSRCGSSMRLLGGSRALRGGTALVLGSAFAARAQRASRDVPGRRSRLSRRDRRDRHGPESRCFDTSRSHRCASSTAATHAHCDPRRSRKSPAEPDVFCGRHVRNVLPARARSRLAADVEQHRFEPSSACGIGTPSSTSRRRRRCSRP